jgi:hypothetical protein
VAIIDGEFGQSRAVSVFEIRAARRFRPTITI